jgi:hypothetical protein
VRVGADAGAHHVQPAAQPALDGGVDVLGRQQREVPLDDLHLVGVDQVVHPPVHDEEGVSVAHLPGVHQHRRVHAHLAGELQRGALGALVVRDRQRERQLHHPVAGGVPVRPDDHVVSSKAEVTGL